MQRGLLASSDASYGWILDLLAGQTPTATWAAAGKLPAGFEPADRFAVLPAGAGRVFMVSLAARAGSASALTSYNALRSGKRRVARDILGLGMRIGLTQRLLPHKIDIGKAAGSAPDQVPDALLSDHLRGLFGRAQVVIAVGSSGGPYRKPVLQVFGADGTPLGYVKIGWNDWTQDAVQREAAALRAYAGRPARLGVPALLSCSSWRGFDLLVTEPLPRRVRRLRDGSPPDTSVIHEISALTPPYTAELASSPWWLGLRARIRSGVADDRASARLALIADRIEDSWGSVALGFGAWHGDFVPWNLATLGGRVFAWDWESSAPDAPIGFDAVHFHFQVSFVARRRPLAEAAATAARDARPALSALGVAAGRHQLIAGLHLVELFVRHEQARSSAGEADGRFYPGVARVLDDALAAGFATSRLSSAGQPS
jgi:hypothetical protein